MSLGRDRNYHTKRFSRDLRLGRRLILIWASLNALVLLVSDHTSLKNQSWMESSTHVYALARDFIFFPVVFILQGWSLELPVFVKDFIVLYGIPFTAVSINAYRMLQQDKELYQVDPVAFETMIRDSARNRNIDEDDLWKRVQKGMDNKYYFYWRVIRAAFRWPITFFRNFMLCFSSNSSVRANAIDQTVSLSWYTLLPIVLAIISFAPDVLLDT